MKLFGFSFLNSVYLLKLNVAQWQMLNLCLVAREPIID